MPVGRSLLAVFALIACVALGAMLGSGAHVDANSPAVAPAQSQPLPPYVPSPPRDTASLRTDILRAPPKLDGNLDLLYRIDILARANGRRIDASVASSLPEILRAHLDSRQIRLDNAGYVQVYADTIGDAAAAAAKLRLLGMEIEVVSREYGIVQGRLPVSAIEQAAALSDVTSIRPPGYGVVDTGSVNTAGDAILDANDLRATFGVNGAGVRVGVLSDGLEGWTDARDDGDLPPTIEFATCDMTAGLPTDPGAGAEGTAMLEIVHDLAPGAELWFGYWQTDLEFISAVDCLADNVDVIIDDLSFFNIGSYNGTSNVSSNLTAEMNDATNRVRAYHKSVGNRALQHYQEDYLDVLPGDPGVQTHAFAATASTTDQLVIGPVDANPVYLADGGFVVIHLQWSDTFGASSNNYNLYLLRNSTGMIVAQSVNPQTGSQNPVETIVYQNNTGVDGFFNIVINKASGATRTFDMFVPICDCAPLPSFMPDQPIINFNTMSSSVPNNADASGRVVTHGAINADDPGNDTIAPYSSRGPTNDDRLKPEAVSIDGVSVTGAGGFPTTFFGTSAAAPHGGAIAALILSCNATLKHGEPDDNPNADRDALRNAMLNSATDLGAGGDDQVYGNGRVDADAAAAAAGCTAATPTPTSTPTATPTKTNTPTPTATATPGTDTDGDGMPDGYESARLCLNAAVADGALDPDVDALTSAFEYLTVGTEPCLNDTDTDGCADGEEIVATAGSHAFGGQRDPLNHWDFYDVNGTRRVDGADIGMVRLNFNGAGPTPPEDMIYDRSAGAAVWAPGPPDNKINAVDIGLVRSAFNDRCDLAP